ncbi:YpiB family protein [Halalkalibacter alkalisediminis]|uniref:YpiB family protein n=1 Tax=Halalkalibacter alkalisediminis TaxID=935616 RepID=A0ABV6NK93_9BACI|nr:YpiB family protein [Halalkalibacter alkalisediminis]
MKNWVSTTEKSNFLKWFLQQHQLKHKDARILIEYLLKQHPILENLTFTSSIKPAEKSVIISSMQSDQPGFVYYNGKTKTEDVSKALGDLMSNPADKLNIVLHFYGKQSNQRYLQLVEPTTNYFVRHKQFQEYSKEVNSLIEKSLIEQEIKKVRDEIDAALDQNDKQLFNRLVERLTELKEIEKNK